jgi:hypothetical protein
VTVGQPEYQHVRDTVQYQRHDVCLLERPKQGTVHPSATSGVCQAAYKTAPHAIFSRAEHLLYLGPTPEKCSLALDKTTTTHGVWQRREGRVHLATSAASSRVPSCRGPIAQVHEQRTPAQTTRDHHLSIEHKESKITSATSRKCSSALFGHPPARPQGQQMIGPYELVPPSTGAYLGPPTQPISPVPQ